MRLPIFARTRSADLLELVGEGEEVRVVEHGGDLGALVAHRQKLLGLLHSAVQPVLLRRDAIGFMEVFAESVVAHVMVGRNLLKGRAVVDLELTSGTAQRVLLAVKHIT